MAQHLDAAQNKERNQHNELIADLFKQQKAADIASDYDSSDSRDDGYNDTKMKSSKKPARPTLKLTKINNDNNNNIISTIPPPNPAQSPKNIATPSLTQTAKNNNNKNKNNNNKNTNTQQQQQQNTKKNNKKQKQINYKNDSKQIHQMRREIQNKNVKINKYTSKIESLNNTNRQIKQDNKNIKKELANSNSTIKTIKTKMKKQVEILQNDIELANIDKTVLERELQQNKKEIQNMENKIKSVTAEANRNKVEKQMVEVIQQQYEEIEKKTNDLIKKRDISHVQIISVAGKITDVYNGINNNNNNEPFTNVMTHLESNGWVYKDTNNNYFAVKNIEDIYKNSKMNEKHSNHLYQLEMKDGIYIIPNVQTGLSSGSLPTMIDSYTSKNGQTRCCIYEMDSNLKNIFNEISCENFENNINGRPNMVFVETWANERSFKAFGKGNKSGTHAKWTLTSGTNSTTHFNDSFDGRLKYEISPNKIGSVIEATVFKKLGFWSNSIMGYNMNVKGGKSPLTIGLDSGVMCENQEQRGWIVFMRSPSVWSWTCQSNNSKMIFNRQMHQNLITSFISKPGTIQILDTRGDSLSANISFYVCTFNRSLINSCTYSASTEENYLQPLILNTVFENKHKNVVNEQPKAKKGGDYISDYIRNKK
eukprot:226827_1